MTKAGEPGNEASLEHLSDGFVIANHFYWWSSEPNTMLWRMHLK